MNPIMTKGLDERSIWLGRNVLPHEPALRAWLQSRRLTGLDVDDIIQETYTRLMALESTSGIKDPKTYTYQVAKSVILTYLRRAKIVPMASVADMDVLGLTSDTPNPEAYALDRDELQRVAEAISGLPERSRTVFKLRRVDEKSQKEIAAELGITEGAVEKLMGEALFNLRNMFGRQGKGRSGASNVRKSVNRDHAPRDRSRD